MVILGVGGVVGLGRGCGCFLRLVLVMLFIGFNGILGFRG